MFLKPQTLFSLIVLAWFVLPSRVFALDHRALLACHQALLKVPAKIEKSSNIGTVVKQNSSSNGFPIDLGLERDLRERFGVFRGKSPCSNGEVLYLVSATHVYSIDLSNLPAEGFGEVEFDLEGTQFDLYIGNSKSSNSGAKEESMAVFSAHELFQNSLAMEKVKNANPNGIKKKRIVATLVNDETTEKLAINQFASVLTNAVVEMGATYSWLLDHVTRLDDIGINTNQNDYSIAANSCAVAGNTVLSIASNQAFSWYGK